MVSIKTSKFIKSLQLKKYRLQEKKFIIEGTKSVNELLQSDFKVTHIIATDKYLDTIASITDFPENLVTPVSTKQLSALSGLKANDTVLAVAECKTYTTEDEVDSKLIALDGIKDPGNMGTIIRIADWYGIKEIICSEDCVDFYNPKVIQSTMGSFTRVKIIETDLHAYLSKNSEATMGAFMQGEDIHHFGFSEKGILVIGNESNGISNMIEPMIKHKITIPQYGQAESLNAGIATAIICDNWISKTS